MRDSSVEYRINGFHAGSLIAIAGLVDFLQFIFGLIPVLGIVIVSLLSVLVASIFSFWLSYLKVEVWGSFSKFGVQLGTFIAEIIPIVGVLPVWTMGIGALLLLVRLEDQKKYKKSES